MPIADMLINDASGHRFISLLDGNAEYNQIFIAQEDTFKTASYVLALLVCLSGL